MKIKEVMKKYHVVPGIAIFLTIIAAALGIKWFGYDGLSIGTGEAAAYLYRYYGWIVAVFLIGAVMLYYFAFVKKSKIQVVFMSAAVFLGIAFSLIVTPNSAADETKHIYAATEYANRLTNISQTNKPYTYYTRVTDADTGLSEKICVDNYSIMGKNFFTGITVEDKYLKEATSQVYNYNAVSAFFYSPAICGIVIGRAIGLNGILTYMLARLLMLTVYVLLGYFALKKLPAGKNIMALIMLMPSAISRAACVSEDAIIHGVIFMFTAYVISFIMSDKKIKTRDAVITFLCGIIIAMSKGGVYLPVLLMLFLVPKKNFGEKIKYPVIVAGSIAAALVAFFVANPTLIGDFVHSDESLVYTDAATGYSISRIVKNPVESFRILQATIFIKTGDYYSEMLAGGFGWLQVYVSDFTVMLCTLLLAIGVLNINGTEKCFTGKQRAVTGAAVLIGACLIIASMWIFWSPDNAGFIQGIQGRYFIPYLFLGLFAVKNHRTIIKKDIGNYLILGVYLVGIITFFEIWVRILI